MIQEQLTKDSVDEVPAVEAGAKLAIIIKFFTLWLSSLVILLVIALMSNIEWARRHIETALQQSFHREVHLGRLSWSIGLHGLAIDSDRFEMREKDKSPFIKSGPSEIGIAVTPLFEKKLVIKHLEFEKPEVWVSQLAPNKWNFSDLLTEGPEIHMLQISKGKLHLANQAATLNDWQEYDVNDIKLEMTLPKNNRNWPLFFSCTLPYKNAEGKTMQSSVRLEATGKGPYKEWRLHKYKVDLQLQNFDAQQYRPLIKSLPAIQGICNLNLKGEGIFNQGFLASGSGSIANLKMEASQNKELEIAQASASTKLLIDPKSLQWQDLKLTLGQWQLNSSGRFINWQKENAQAYEAKVGGNLSDLKGFFKKVLSRFLPGEDNPGEKFTDYKLGKMYTATKTGQLCGSATIELKLNGDKSQQKVSTSIKANGIPLAQLIDEKFGDAFLDDFKFDPDTPIKGEVNIDPSQRLELKDLEIPMDGALIKLSGFVDQASKKTEIDFKAENLRFEKLRKQLEQSKNELLQSFLNNSNPKFKPLLISGPIDLKGKYLFDGKTQNISLDSSLKGLSIKRSEANTPSCSNIRGRISYADKKVEVKQLSGSTANGIDAVKGDFLLNANFYPQDSSRSELDFQAHQVSVSQLREWVDRFGFNLQEVGFDRLNGELAEVKAHMLTRNKQTSSSFTINPANLLVNPLAGKGQDAAAQQFRLSSGVLSYDDHELKATEVTLTSRAGKLLLTGSMLGKLDSLKFNNVRIKTDGFELSDLHSILKGNFNSGPRKTNSVPQFFLPSNQTTLHGKVYGDMLFTAQGSGLASSGVVGFSNAGGRFGKTQVAVEKLTGLAVISKDQLVLQETSGQIGKSNFSLDGVITNYAGPQYSWEGQLRGHFYPEEVDTIMENLGHGIAVDSSSIEPLNLRVTGSGDKSIVSLRFRGRASATYGISLKTAFGTFHQPKGRPLRFQGGLDLNQALSELALKSFSLESASEQLHANGFFRWADEKAEKPASLSFALITPQAVKTATLVEIISQTPSEKPPGVGGSSLVNLKVEGPVNDLVLSGTVSLEKNSLQNTNIENLSGKLDLPGWHLNRGQSSDQGSSIAKLQLKSLNMGGLALHDAGGTLSLDNNKIIFKDLQAAMSGGKLSLSGYYNQSNQSFHADLNGSKLVVDELVKDLIDHSGGVTGLADISLSLDSPGGAAGTETLKTLSGSGHFNVYQGSVASFGKLQEKLNEANLLQQGIFGFNVNNLLQAMMPVKSGQFNEVSGKFNIGKGAINFDELRFEGNNLRMRAVGKFDFLGRNLNVDVAGDIPRVSSSIIPGAIGEMSRKVTLQRMFSIVTFRKLKDLPALPLLGDIANDDPRAFAFSVSTSTEQAKLITQAVEKSFKWLPNKPFASAHPVPGI
ncbi:MAG: AsmA-like C-terminal region-containing protein [Candidatus Obscuribacterales bacterium]|nr:AsmA-like C-terminal region-containing protein [Candidatus Obscuribacterales bacterium]